MKGVVIFDERANLAFYSVDKEMEEYILGRMQELEEEAGARFDGGQPQRDLRDTLGAFFLPLYTSFDVMNSLKKPVLAIEGDDGHLIVFRKFGANVYIAINKEEGETEETMGHKLSVFNSIVHFLHGPVDSKFNTSDLNERSVIWKQLAGLLQTYDTLYLTDQVFLVEALEHVQFGQLTAAHNIVQKLTREALDHQCNGGLEGVNHSMLLTITNTRFLAVSGKHPRMETADILLSTLLVHYHYHYNKMDNSTSTSLSDETQEEDPEESEERGSSNSRASGDGHEDGNGELFKTPRSTPGLDPNREEGHAESRENQEEDAAAKVRRGSLDHDYAEVKLPELVHETRSLYAPQAKRLHRRFKNALASLRPPTGKGGLSSPHTYSFKPGDTSKFMEHLVFLQASVDDYAPHVVYSLEVYPGIVLVLVAEHGPVATQTLASTLCHTLKTLVGVDWLSRVPCSGIYDTLEDCIKKIKDQVTKESQNITDERKNLNLRGLLVKIVNCWTNMKKAEVKAFLNHRGSGRELEGIQPARIEACAGDLKEKLLKLFEVLFMTPRTKNVDTGYVVGKLMSHFNPLVQDYGEFLALKGTFNIPIVSFSMMLPGLVHFLFIDRSFNELTSPSLATDDQVAISYIQNRAKVVSEPPALFLRRKIWSMVQRVQKYLTNGYTLQTWLDDDFLYTYYFWINIPSNSTMGTKKFYTPSNIKGTEYSSPGVIGSSFFKDVHASELIKGGGCYVYELYCLHEPKISIQEASTHCRHLADKLWPSSREAVAPFSLIN